MKKSNYILALLLFCTGAVQSQSIVQYDDYLYTVSRQPASTRAEAMGYAGVTLEGSTQDARMNPAGLVWMSQKLVTEYTASSPIFIDSRSNYRFLGVAGMLNKNIAIGAHQYRSLIYRPILGFDKNGRHIQPNLMREANNLLTVAAKISNILSVGINAGLFVNDIDQSGKFKSPLVDAGVLYMPATGWQGPRVKESRFRLGISATNLLGSNTYYNIQDVKDTQAIAGVLRVGAALHHVWNADNFVHGHTGMVPAQNRTLALLFQLQYLKYMHTLPKGVAESEKILFHGYSAGVELEFLKLLYLRLGYRYEKRQGNNDMNSPVVNYPYLKGMTQGLGIKLPFYSLSRCHLPFEVAIDLAHQKPFQWVKPSLPYFYYRTTSVAVRLNWQLQRQAPVLKVVPAKTKPKG
ncbi:MAG: hypothetical protein JNL57_06300 [Bacteroidetes bacterium]|nr:hypothetical protein [Bacteroidota bacterium]